MRAVPVLLAAACLTSVAAVAALPSPAWAQATDKEKRARAKQLYDDAITHYNLGEFDEAIALFKEAYELTHEPVLLFNIAQAYRLKEDYKQALYFYRTYLRLSPEAANRADVERWIAEIEKLLAEQQRVKDSPPQDVLPQDGQTPTTQATRPDPEPQPDPEPDPVPPTEPAPRGGRSLKIAGIATGGGGVLLLATGVFFGVSAADGWDTVNAAAASGEPWTDELQSAYDGAERDELTATILYVAGGAAVVTGGVLYFLGARQDRARVAATPVPGGAVVGASWTW